MAINVDHVWMNGVHYDRYTDEENGGILMLPKGKQWSAYKSLIDEMRKGQPEDDTVGAAQTKEKKLNNTSKASEIAARLESIGFHIREINIRATHSGGALVDLTGYVGVD